MDLALDQISRRHVTTRPYSLPNKQFPSAKDPMTCSLDEIIATKKSSNTPSQKLKNQKVKNSPSPNKVLTQPSKRVSSKRKSNLLTAPLSKQRPSENKRLTKSLNKPLTKSLNKPLTKSLNKPLTKWLKSITAGRRSTEKRKSALLGFSGRNSSSALALDGQTASPTTNARKRLSVRAPSGRKSAGIALGEVKRSLNGRRRFVEVPLVSSRRGLEGGGGNRVIESKANRKRRMEARLGPLVRSGSLRGNGSSRMRGDRQLLSGVKKEQLSSLLDPAKKLRENLLMPGDRMAKRRLGGAVKKNLAEDSGLAAPSPNPSLWRNGLYFTNEEAELLSKIRIVAPCDSGGGSGAGLSGGSWRDQQQERQHISLSCRFGCEDMCDDRTRG